MKIHTKEKEKKRGLKIKRGIERRGTEEENEDEVKYI